MSALRSRAPWIVLSTAFAAHVGMTVVLTGRMPAPALTAALSLGAFVCALAVAGRPIASMKRMPVASAIMAAAGGLLAIFAAPALTAGVRMSDAPAGSVVVFWIAGGWTLVAGIAAAIASMRSGRHTAGWWSLVGAAVAAAGVAGVVSNWERPSSFSPLVRFATQEGLILTAGLLFVAGGLLVVRASRDGGLDAARVWAALAASVASFTWYLSSGPAAGLSSLSEQSVAVVLGAAAWGVVSIVWPSMLRDRGPAAAGAALALAPVLMSVLALVEQAVGVAGPQPLVLPGVVAGSALVACGALAMIAAHEAVRSGDPGLAFKVLLAMPLFAALVGLTQPTIVARAEVTGAVGAFSGSWIMSGAESVAGLAAVGLAALLLLSGLSRSTVWPMAAGVVACLAWPSLLGVPTHVLQAALAPEIQQYYGTEYGSIVFSSLANYPMMAAVVATGSGLLVLVSVRLLSRRSGRGTLEHGGS